MNANRHLYPAVPRRKCSAAILLAAISAGPPGMLAQSCALTARAHSAVAAAAPPPQSPERAVHAERPEHPEHREHPERPGLLAQARAATQPPQASLPDPQWPEAQSVNELMQAELRAALLAQRQRQPGRARAAAADPAGGIADEPAADRVDLAAIYGVGKRLKVELIVNGQARQYGHGKKWSDEGAGIKDAYALVGIDGRCVKLDGPGGIRTVCLQRRAEGSK